MLPNITPKTIQDQLGGMFPGPRLEAEHEHFEPYGKRHKPLVPSTRKGGLARFAVCVAFYEKLGIEICLSDIKNMASMLFDDANVRRGVAVESWNPVGKARTLKKKVRHDMIVVPQRQVFHPRLAEEPKDWEVGTKVLLDEPVAEVQLLGFREE